VIKQDTIGPHNYNKLNEFVKSIKTSRDFCNPILEPVFSKGCDRLIEFIKFIENPFIWQNIDDNIKILLIAQFIIINQIFGDGNHRTAQHVLDSYSTYSTENKRNIMLVTKRIHEWNGDLKTKNFWIQQKYVSQKSKTAHRDVFARMLGFDGEESLGKTEFELWLPDFTKVEDMCKYINKNL
jgi:hypothetical protein